MSENQEGAKMSDEHVPASDWCTGCGAYHEPRPCNWCGLRSASFAELRWKTVADRLFVNHAVVCLSCLPELHARNRHARGYVGVATA